MTFYFVYFDYFFSFLILWPDSVFLHEVESNNNVNNKIKAYSVKECLQSLPEFLQNIVHVNI